MGVLSLNICTKTQRPHECVKLQRCEDSLFMYWQCSALVIRFLTVLHLTKLVALVYSPSVLSLYVPAGNAALPYKGDDLRC